MLSKSKFNLFLIMKINKKKKNLLDNFLAITFRNRNSVSKKSKILFLQIETKIEAEQWKLIILKNLIVNFYISNKILETEFSVAKGHPILPANVPAINLQRKIRSFQFSSLIPFSNFVLFSLHLLPPTISDGVFFRFKIL